MERGYALIVSNCADINIAPTPFELFRNNGDQTFSNIAGDSGMGLVGYWMSSTFGDYNGDGHIDLFATNVGVNVKYSSSSHALLLAQGDGTFADNAVAARVAEWEFGWGAVSADLDNAAVSTNIQEPEPRNCDSVIFTPRSGSQTKHESARLATSHLRRAVRRAAVSSSATRVAAPK